MTTFVSRTEELSLLETEFSKDCSSLIVMYGRRRVGKTSLLLEFGKDKKMLYFIVSEELESENIKNFKNQIADFNYDEVLKNANVNNWETLFKWLILILNREKQKIVLIIDEFQYLGKNNRSFLSAFQHIWDTILQKENIMVILCGSLIPLMEEQTLSHSSHLHGSISGHIKLTQIPFKNYSEFFPNKSYKELIEFYSVTGGIPKYIKLFCGDNDLISAIEENVLKRQSSLYEEPLYLLQKEVTEIGSYFSIIKTIAAGNHKLSAIATSLGLPQTGLTKYLETLINLNILSREIPVTEENPKNSKRGFYRIKDNFILFWFKFVYPNMCFLETGNTEIVVNKLKKYIARKHIAYIYKDICIQKMAAMNASDTFDFNFNKVGRWWDNNTEIDIVALSTDAKAIIFGECKYKNEPIDADVYYSLLEKSKKVKFGNDDRKEIFVFFSISGYTTQFEKLAEEQGNILLLI